MFVFFHLTLPTASPDTLGVPYVKLTCFVTLWQTLAGLLYSLGFPLLNQSNPLFLVPTSHFLREAY